MKLAAIILVLGTVALVFMNVALVWWVVRSKKKEVMKNGKTFKA